MGEFKPYDAKQIELIESIYDCMISLCKAPPKSKKAEKLVEKYTNEKKKYRLREERREKLRKLDGNKDS